MKKYIPAIILSILAIAFTVAVKVVDPQYISPNGTPVGFGLFNYSVHWTLGVNYTWYLATELIGYGALLVVASFGLIGLKQLIQRKSLLAVDRDVITLGVTYAIMGVIYVLFEFIAINYRPVVMPGELECEASFPSSHTMLVCVVFATAIIEWCKFFRKKPVLKVLLVIISVLMIVLMVAGRLLSGCHWATDIVGGVLYASAIVAFYAGVRR